MHPPSRKTISISFALLGIAVLVTAGFALKGSLLEQWYLWRLDSEDVETRENAAAHLGELRSVKAIPLLVGMLEENGHHAPHAAGDSKSSKERREYAEYIWAHIWTGHALVSIGDSAIPALGDALEQDRMTSYCAALALAHMGQRGVRELARALLRGNGQAHEWAERVLEWMGPEAKSAVTTLVQALRDERWEVRKCACQVLSSIGADASPAVPALCEIAEKKGERRLRYLRVRAIHALIAIAPKGGLEATVWTTLRSAAQDEDGTVRRTAAEALSVLGENPPDVQERRDTQER